MTPEQLDHIEKRCSHAEGYGHMSLEVPIANMREIIAEVRRLQAHPLYFVCTKCGYYAQVNEPKEAWDANGAPVSGGIPRGPELDEETK